MLILNIVLGQVVYSKAGRDEGKVFVITKIIDQSYVCVSDGDLRRVENPKKKKLKHLVITSVILDNVAQKLSSGYKLSNADIRKAIADFKQNSVDID